MTDTHTCLGRLCLASGAWADWFSGSMSALAVVVALAGYFINDLYRRRDSHTRDIATAQLIGLKLWKVMNASHDLYRHVWSDELQPHIGGHQSGLIWRRTHPMIGIEIDEATRLDAAEMSLLVQIKQVNFLTELVLVISRYESTVLSMKEYRQQYEEIHKMMPIPERMDGAAAIHMLTKEEFLRIQPYSNALEQIILSIRYIINENVERCDGLAQNFYPILKKRYPKERFIKIVPPKNPGDIATPPPRSDFS